MQLVRLLPSLRRARSDAQGSAMVEFALVGPVVLALILGILEFSTLHFVQALLEGGARDAARFGITGQGVVGASREAQILQILAESTVGLVDMDKIELTTLVYDSFESVGKPEPFTDQNGNGAYDEGEPFVDINGNGVWDADMGAAGLGGPGDVVVYRIAYDWEIMIPIFIPFFSDGTARLEANIAVRNEPFPGLAPAEEP